MKHARTLFALLLFLSSLVTGFLGIRTLLDPEAMMSTFGVPPSELDGLMLLIAVLGSALLSLAAVVWLAGWWSWQGRSEGRTLGLVCGATLLLVAVSAWRIGGSIEVLLLDGVRGTLVLLLGFLWKPNV